MSDHSSLLKDISGNGLHDQMHIREQLEIIKGKLDAEITAKQKTIERQELEIQHLHSLNEEKSSLLLQNNEKLAECVRTNEGNRQLINKLLNNIQRLQQDIEWYKRTYETRSLLGTFWEKIFKMKRRGRI